MKSQANRGMSFEELIEYANRRYRRDAAAVITKQHTLCTPLRNGTGRIVSAKYEEKATVDYMGCFGKYPVAFEAKHCSENRIALARVERHQHDFLNDWCTQSGAAIAFVLVSFKLDGFFLVPWQYWTTAWAATGKASIRMDELPLEWRVNPTAANPLDYLQTVRQLWRTQG